MAKYTPYTGPAGPTLRQCRTNDRALFEALQASREAPHEDTVPIASVEYKVDSTYSRSRPYDHSAKEKWVIVTTNDGEKWHISYDRWGFCCDHASQYQPESFDQLSLDDVLKWFKDYEEDADETVEDDEIQRSLTSRI